MWICYQMTIFSGRSSGRKWTFFKTTYQTIITANMVPKWPTTSNARGSLPPDNTGCHPTYTRKKHGTRLNLNDSMYTVWLCDYVYI
jgi:hypothetical protein